MNRGPEYNDRQRFKGYVVSDSDVGAFSSYSKVSGSCSKPLVNRFDPSLSEFDGDFSSPAFQRLNSQVGGVRCAVGGCLKL